MQWQFWRRWAGRGEKNAYGPRLYMWGLGGHEEAFSFCDPRLLTKEGYNVNVTVFSCVNLRATSGAGVPWVLYRKGRTSTSKVQKVMSLETATKAWARATETGDQRLRKAVEMSEVEDHPLLRLWERPNPWHGGTAWREARYAQLMLFGTTFTKLAGPGDMTKGPPRELHLLRPDTVTIVPDKVEFIREYHQRVDGERDPRRYQVGEVLRRALPSMDNEYWGTPPLVVAMRVTRTDNEAVRWNFFLLKNSARPPGMLSTPPGVTLIGPQMDDLRKEVDQMLDGPENAGRPFLGQGGMKWEAFGYSPADMDWSGLRKMTRIEIAQAYGIDPQMLGDGEAQTFANFKESRKKLVVEHTLPMLEKDRDDLNNDLVPRFGDNLRIDLDRDQIEELREEQAQLWDRIERATFITLDEKRSACGYEDYVPDDKNPAKRIWVPAGMAPIEDAATALTASLQQDDEPEPKAAGSRQPAA